MKTFKTIAIKNSPVEVSVCPTMFIKGNNYRVRKNPLDDMQEYVIVEGYFANSLGGKEFKEQNILKTIAKEYLQYI